MNIINKIALKIASDLLNQPVFDEQNGLGNVPIQKDINYFGFIREMKISEFRKLVPSGRLSEGIRFNELKQKIKNGTSVAPPFLDVEWNEELECWQCYGHEGRSRLDAIKELYGDIVVPVHIFPYRMRAKDITQNMKNAIILKQQG